MDGASGRPGVGSTGTQPPTAPTTYSGKYIAGLLFEVTQGGQYFEGYWWWVPTGGDTNAAIGFALWQITNTGTGIVIPAASVLWSGTFTAGAWNFVPCTPIPLTPNIPYVAAVGFSTTIGFPDTKNQFGTGDPYASGITNGPLHAYGGTETMTTVIPQSPYSTTSADASVTLPVSNDANDILWLDVQVSDVVPVGTPQRAWPNMVTPWPTIQTANDQTGYTLGMEFSVSQSSTLGKIWHYSPAGSTALPTRCAIWDVTAQAVVGGTDNISPTWLKPDGTLAAAGAGWIYCDYSGTNVVLSSGKNYKVSTYHGPGATWFGATPNVFGAGNLQASGFTNGALIIPGNSGATPGQQSWNAGSWGYPATSANPEADWIDVEVIPTPAASYRIMDGQSGRPGNGPTTAISYTGNFVAGTAFSVRQGDCWFEGYYWWVCPTGGLTTPQKCALWQTDGNTQQVIPGSVITSGTLVSGWNYIPLPAPVQLAADVVYVAATGVNGNFPDSDTTGTGTGAVDSFGTGGHINGIANGPLFAYSDSANGGLVPAALDGGGGLPQGLFSTAGTDPSTTFPGVGSNSANFWIDVQVSVGTPASYAGSFRAWPNMALASVFTSGDSAVNYVVGTEMHLSKLSTLNRIWYYSPSGSTQLATECAVWDVITQTKVAENTSPAWSGAAGSGWVSCGFGNVTLPAGIYRVAVYNGAATPSSWSAKQLYYFNIGNGSIFGMSNMKSTGPSFDGIHNGPLYMPSLSGVGSSNYYTASGASPDFDAGGPGPGQSPFAVGPPNAYPNIYVKGLGQTYWVDMEVTPLGASASGTLLALFP